MKQENKVDIKNNIKIDFRLTRSLEILRASNNDLGQMLDDYALENPILKVIKPRNDEKFDPISTIEQKSTTSLDMHLIDQLALKDINDASKNHLYMLISMIDSKGFLPYTIKEVSKRLGVAVDEARKLIKIIQSLDPIGVGAKNYVEGFAIQLHAKKMFTEKARIILSRYFKPLVLGQYDLIKENTGIDVDYCKKLLSEIKKLSPNPASVFGASESVYVVPDIIIKNNAGEIQACLSESSIYKVQINDDYRLDGMNKEDKKIVDGMLYNANYIGRSLKKRYDTLLKIAKEIAHIQQGFFSGTDSMCAMKKKDIAIALGMHPSTISRALKDKFILFNDEMQNADCYFSGKSQLSDGRSPYKIKQIIKNIIDDENKKYPISDEGITFYLDNSGIKISRRTVSKYRASMDILPSGLRKNRY